MNDIATHREISSMPLGDEKQGVCPAHAGMEKTITKMDEKLDKLIEGVLVGNGAPSMKQRLHDVERSLEEVRRAREEERRRDEEETRRREDRQENRMLAVVRLLGPYIASIGSAGAVYLGLKGH